MDVRDVSPEAAARAMAGLSRRDARGLMTEADILPMCHYSRCVRVSGAQGSAVLALQEQNGVLWVEAAQAEGETTRMTDLLDDVLSASDATSIAFMTQRRGLVRRALARGYRITGYVLKKDK